MRWCFLFHTILLSFVLLIQVRVIVSESWLKHARESVKFESKLSLSTPLELSKTIEDKTSIVKPPFEIQAHGTTTLAFKHNDSIIVCVDSKASIGNYVGSRTVKKVFPLTSRIVATMAGGAADCAFWIRAAATQAKLIENKYKTPLRVRAVATILANQLRTNRGSGNYSFYISLYDVN